MKKNKNVAIEHKNCIKFLGLLIDETLDQLEKPYSYPHRIISKTVGLLANIVADQTLLNIYKSLIALYKKYELLNFLGKCI